MILALPHLWIPVPIIERLVGRVRLRSEQFDARQPMQFEDTVGPIGVTIGESIIPAGSGTAFGDFTSVDGGGQAQAFNGVTSQTTATSARTVNSATGYLGKDWGAGQTHAITKVIYYGPNNGGIQEAETSIRIEVREHTAAPGTPATDGSLIGTTGTFDGSPSSTAKTIICTGSQKRAVWIYCSEGNAANKWACAELEFYATD